MTDWVEDIDGGCWFDPATRETINKDALPDLYEALELMTKKDPYAKGVRDIAARALAKARGE